METCTQIGSQCDGLFPVNSCLSGIVFTNEPTSAARVQHVRNADGRRRYLWLLWQHNQAAVSAMVNVGRVLHVLAQLQRDQRD